MNPCPKKARMAVFIKKHLTYSREFKYENDLNSFIWLKIQIGNKKPIIFGGGYGQITLPCEMRIKDSKSCENQIQRFTNILN